MMTRDDDPRGDFLAEIRGALPRKELGGAGELDAWLGADERRSAGFDEQLFRARTAGGKVALRDPDDAGSWELLALPSTGAGRAWLLQSASTQLHAPGTRPRWPAPEGVRSQFQPPFSGSSSWHFPRITKKGKHWSVDPEWSLDPGVGNLNICCVVHHVRGDTRTFGVIKQMYTVPQGVRALRIAADVDIIFDMFAWLNNEDQPWSGAGCRVCARVRIPGQPEEPGPVAWAPVPIMYEGFVQTPSQMADTQSFAARIESTERVASSGPVEVCIQAEVFTSTQDQNHSGAGARAIVQIHNLAVEHVI
jgi:hypothetical protein